VERLILFTGAAGDQGAARLQIGVTRVGMPAGSFRSCRQSWRCGDALRIAAIRRCL